MNITLNELELYNSLDEKIMADILGGFTPNPLAPISRPGSLPSWAVRKRVRRSRYIVRLKQLRRKRHSVK